MRIAFDTLSENPYAPSSAINYLVSLALTLGRVAAEHQLIIIVSPANAHLFAPAASKHVRLVYCPVSNELIAARIAVQQVLQPFLLYRLGADVMLGYNVVPLVSPCATVVKVSTLHHYVTPGEFTRSVTQRARGLYRRLAFAAAARRSEAVIANSTYTRDAILRYVRVPPERVHVVPEAVDDCFEPAEDKLLARQQVRSLYAIDRDYVLFVSTIWPYKNLHTLLQAFSLAIHKWRLDLDLVVAGKRGASSEYESQLDRLIARLAIGSRVRFLGEITQPQLPALYSAARVFVNPSRAETYGKPVIEAMRCCTPVVAAAATSLPELVSDAGLLVDPDDPESMAEAISLAATDECLRRDLTERGLVHSAQFTWPRVAHGTLEACQAAFTLRSSPSRPGAC